jgi:zinc D-Ala-D-Ala carboxypeptidase
MQLSEHFTSHEFEYSNQAIQLGIDNKMGIVHTANATALCLNVLEPIRAQFGVTTITSGYRSDALNKAVHGAKTSQHNEGKAADVRCDKISSLGLFKWIIANLKYDQCVYEMDLDKGSVWVHVSWNGTKNRNESLKGIRKGGETHYQPFKGV